MKKLFFVAALGIAGLLSAKSNSKLVKSKESIKNTTTKVTKAKAITWITVHSPCGAVYYLAADSYSGCTWDDFWSDVDYFNAVKCGSSAEKWT